MFSKIFVLLRGKFQANPFKYFRCAINTYDLNVLKKKKTLKLPKEVPTQDVAFLRFTEDSRGLAVLSKEPDAFLTIFYFDKSETVIVGRVSNGNQKGLTAEIIACNLNDTGLVAVGGKTSFFSLLLAKVFPKSFRSVINREIHI